MTWPFFAMIGLGTVLLGMSLVPIAAILRTLAVGRIRTLWGCLRVLIVAFVAGYATFAALNVGIAPTTADLVVAAILMAGGGFVLIVARLSALTTIDLMRIAALERDVNLDPLTGTFNRRFLDAKIEEEVSRAREDGRALSALLIDLDHFKRINDNYGHPVGDLVLRYVSTRIVERVREGDAVVRYGGEEFVVLALDCGLDAAAALAERVRLGICEEEIALPDGRKIAVSASVGVATLESGEEPPDFLRRMDEALYAAKRTGRNRVYRALGAT